MNFFGQINNECQDLQNTEVFIKNFILFIFFSDSQGGKREIAEEKLRQEKRTHPGKIHYFVAASKELPGKFMLSYMPRLKARHEYITVLPEGFRFRQQTFDSLSSLFKWFKEHFRDPIPGTPVTPRNSATQRTPYMTGTPGAITPGAMSLAAANTPFGGNTPGGGYNINTPYTPSGQTPILTPYNTPGPSNTPRAAHMGPPPIPHNQHNMPPPPQRRSYHQPSPSGYGRSPAGGPHGGGYGRPSPSGYNRQQPSPSGYGRSPAGGPHGGGYGRSPAGGRRGGDAADSWRAVMDGWDKGRSNRTPRNNDGGNTPRGN